MFLVTYECGCTAEMESLRECPDMCPEHGEAFVSCLAAEKIAMKPRLFLVMKLEEDSHAG